MNEPEFSRPFDRRGITAETIELTATAEECARLASRFGLVAVHALKASLSLEAVGDNVCATGKFTADIVQTCAVSGDELPVSLAENLSFRFVPEAEWADEDADEIELEADQLDDIPYDGTSFDLGEAVAQSLALAIDPYAIGPEAEKVRQEQGLLDQGASGPLAEALAALTKN